jgi:hypothetical protein
LPAGKEPNTTMVQTCPRCQRVNPKDAVFCYNDGVFLQQGTAPSYLSQFTQEFTFPSGRKCRSVEELVQGCNFEWESARDLLRRGEIARFLQKCGRGDLARSAQEAQTQPDADIALYHFLRQLPAQPTQTPRLDLRPRRMSLGPFRPGEQRQAGLTISNVGQGILQGKVTVSEGWEWLKLIGPTGQRECAVKTPRDQNIGLKLDTKGLVAGQQYSAKLTVITNGGITEVPIRVDLSVLPFPHAPFQGARSPRELAERMLKAPKQAVPLLESGVVAGWFATNGWSYPVAGVPARDIAAVQQFFEALGLSKPPPLQISQVEVLLRSRNAEVARGQIVLRTPSKKWVYAEVDSDVPWLRVTTPAVSGPQQAPIGFEAVPQLLANGHPPVGTLRIRANAGQKFAVRVKLDVDRQAITTRSGVKLEPAAPGRPLLPRSPGGGGIQLIVLGMATLLIFRIMLVPAVDLYARLMSGSGTLAFWAAAPTADGAYLSRIALATCWIGAIFAVVLVRSREAKLADYFCALIAGTFAGLVLGATMGCFLIVAEAPPRWLLASLDGGGGSTAVGTAVWIALVLCWWGIVGGMLGLVATLTGRAGRQVLRAVTSPLALFCSGLGLNGLARQMEVG